MLPQNVILSTVEESLLQQTGCLHCGRHDNFTFFRMWVYCYIITKKYFLMEADGFAWRYNFKQLLDFCKFFTM